MKPDDTKGQVPRVNNADAAALYDNGGLMPGEITVIPGCPLRMKYSNNNVFICLALVKSSTNL